MDKRYLQYAVETLESLCQIHSPSGFTGKAVDFIKREIESFGLQAVITPSGAVHAFVRGAADICDTVVIAHTDTLGAVVKEIKPNGVLTMSRIAGTIGNACENENITVYTLDGRSYSGSIHFDKASKHIFREDSEIARTPESMELYLDETVFLEGRRYKARNRGGGRRRI